MDVESFPGRLRAIRDHRGFSQVDLAQRVGVDPIVISRYERGKITPHLERAKAIAKELHVSLDWLFAGEGPSPIAAPSALGPPQPVPLPAAS